MSIVMAECPVCKVLQPHGTPGVQEDKEGKGYQTMVCSKCKTSNQIYTGKEGEDFQSNYEISDNTDLSKI